ncbi:MAG: DUF58 domain-containing protein [gamma proteobacterium symbiont of Lucinoma myriamae]|nr:DUF58 domain-containing protein [gamma proteobacterium symbiont of Lucinoma myriamae]MCU7818474.1 DUF58 domain-containing protein [gamma proteobacterium symbiont of Lucinoma myriamae]MCU7833559.1 DUF58 domain-containing protein [gamma proteobacterium symbiont of Lucinoma myriamae]
MNSLVFFFTFLLTGIGLVSMHMTQQNLLGLQFSIAHVKPVFCYQTISLPLAIKQLSQHKILSNKLSNYSIAVKFSSTKHSLSSATRSAELVDVPFKDKTILHLSHATSQRGPFELSPITISSCYPLGLFRAWANIQLNSDAIVYPNPAPPFLHKPQSGSDSEGQGSLGRGFDDFSGFKAHQPGESLKHIHWKAYAREQGLLSKTFSGANNYEYWLNWKELSGGIEQRLSQLCRLIIDAETQGDRYGLMLPDKTVNISQGEAHQHQCLKTLAMYQAKK